MRFAYMGSQFFIADRIQFDTDPAAYTYVGRPEVGCGRRADERSLEAGRRGQPDRNVPVVVVVVGKHGEDLFAHEEGGFAVREFFRGLRKHGTDAPHAPEMVFASGRGFAFCHGSI
jgi:hypothetical protein